MLSPGRVHMMGNAEPRLRPHSQPQDPGEAMDGVKDQGQTDKEPGQAGSRPSFSSSGRHRKRQPAGSAPACYFGGKLYTQLSMLTQHNSSSEKKTRKD